MLMRILVSPGVKVVSSDIMAELSSLGQVWLGDWVVELVRLLFSLTFGLRDKWLLDGVRPDEGGMVWFSSDSMERKWKWVLTFGFRRR